VPSAGCVRVLRPPVVNPSLSPSTLHRPEHRYHSDNNRQQHQDVRKAGVPAHHWRFRHSSTVSALSSPTTLRHSFFIRSTIPLIVISRTPFDYVTTPSSIR
jgi:hypothetical protein